MAHTPVSMQIHGHRVDLAAYGEVFVGDGDFLLFGDDEDARSYISSNHLMIETTADDKNVKIQSRDYTRTSGDATALQLKPNMSVGGTVGITGIEVSPRFASGKLGSKIVGIMSNPILKGAAGGDLSSAMRCYEGKLESDSGSTRTLAAAYVLHAMQALHGTVTLGPFVIGVDNAGGNVAWSAFARFAGNQAGIWHSDPTTEPSTAAGYIKVMFGTTARYIQLYSTAPTD